VDLHYKNKKEVVRSLIKTIPIAVLTSHKQKSSIHKNLLLKSKTKMTIKTRMLIPYT
jgi:hypothetical protein